MPVASTFALTHQLASGLYRNMSEFVRTCAIYIGIAVLVAAVMIVGMPSLRSQARQMHGALLQVLAPDSFVPAGGVAVSPPATLVGAISLDTIPGATLPPPATTPSETGTRAPAQAAAPAPAASPAGSAGQVAVQPGEADDLGPARESPAQVFASG